MSKKNVLWGVLLALAIAAFLSPFASPYPDGLERVAEDKGFLHLAEGKELLRVWMPDYVFPGVGSEAVATALAGVVGTVLVFVAMYVLGRVLVRPKDGRGAGAAGPS